MDSTYFVPGWIPPTWIHDYNDSLPMSKRIRLERAFLFTEPDPNHSDFSGKVASYPSGGYIADLTDDPLEATQLLADLEANNWIDQYTRALPSSLLLPYL